MGAVMKLSKIKVGFIGLGNRGEVLAGEFIEVQTR